MYEPNVIIERLLQENGKTYGLLTMPAFPNFSCDVTEGVSDGDSYLAERALPCGYYTFKMGSYGNYPLVPMIPRLKTFGDVGFIANKPPRRGKISIDEVSSFEMFCHFAFSVAFKKRVLVCIKQSKDFVNVSTASNEAIN